MKTIVILTRREGAAEEDYACLSAAELRAIWRGMATDAVRAAYRLAEGAGAVLEMETSSVDEARSYIESLPYVQANLLDVQYCALKPFSAFESLAAPSI